MASSAQKNCYFKFDNGVITEYKGLAENITLGNVVIKPLARSEEFRSAWLNSYEKKDNTITIQNTNNNKISEIIIQSNSCARNMTFPANDLAYASDIDSLDEKINALAVNSHNNDAIITTTRNDFPTIDEVNTALDELKSGMVNMDIICVRKKKQIINMPLNLWYMICNNFLMMIIYHGTDLKPIDMIERIVMLN